MFGQSKFEDEMNKIVDTFNTENLLLQSDKGDYNHGHIWTNNIPYEQLPHLWNQQYSLGA